MDYFDVRHVPDDFLRGRWVTSTLSEGKALGRRFGHHAKPLFDAATPDHKFRLGFSSARYQQGKTTFIKSMLHEAYPPTRDDYIDEDGQYFTNASVIRTPTGHKMAYYDAVWANPLRLLLPEDRGLKKLKQEASVHVVEWPEKDRKDPNYSALWRLQVLKGDQREWSLYAPDKVAEALTLDNILPGLRR